MNRQQSMKDKQIHCKLYNFIEFKKRKPFFKKPIKITVGNPINDTYYMVGNLVYKEKQILALKLEQDSNMIVLVEAIIENGQLIHISKLSEEFLGDVSLLLKKTI